MSDQHGLCSHLHGNIHKRVYQSPSYALHPTALVHIYMSYSQGIAGLWILLRLRRQDTAGRIRFRIIRPQQYIADCQRHGVHRG